MHEMYVCMLVSYFCVQHTVYNGNFGFGVRWLLEMQKQLRSSFLMPLMLMRCSAKSMLEATPVCQGVWADNLLQLAKPKNPFSDLLDNTASVTSVRSEECHMLLLGTVSGVCSDCKTSKHQLQMQATQEKKALTRAQPLPKYALNMTLSTPQKLAKLAALANEKMPHAKSDNCKIILPHPQL